VKANSKGEKAAGLVPRGAIGAKGIKTESMSEDLEKKKNASSGDRKFIPEGVSGWGG